MPKPKTKTKTKTAPKKDPAANFPRINEQAVQQLAIIDGNAVVKRVLTQQRPRDPGVEHFQLRVVQGPNDNPNALLAKLTRAQTHALLAALNEALAVV